MSSLSKIPHPAFGPARKACTRCRLHKRKCDKARPSCALCVRLGLVELCNYEESVASPFPPALASTDALKYASNPDVSADIKASILTSLCNTNPGKVIAGYSETIHPWFSILSPSTLCGHYPLTWDAVSVDFALLCFAIVLLTCHPQTIEGSYKLHTTQRSMYLLSKTWIAVLEGTEFNSVDFVKAKLLIVLFEVSHGFDSTPYLSIANVVRSADALVVFQNKGLGQSWSSSDRQEEEYRIMWWGIAILDRYIATINGKWSPVTRCRTIPPSGQTLNVSHLQANPPLEISKLFEASTLLDKVHTALHQPTTQISFNIEEVTAIVMTLISFETVITQSLPADSKIFSSSLTISSTALLLAFENGTKATCSGASICAISQANDAIENLIDDIVERVATLQQCSVAEESTVPAFVAFLVYKTAAITTGRLQNDIKPEANLQRLRLLRDFLVTIAKRWLAGGRFLELLDEDTPPRILKALRE